MSGDLNDGLGPYSKMKDTVTFHSTTPIRPATEDEWARAKPLARGSTSLAGDAEIGEEDNHDLVFAGRRFTRSGEHLALATGSANQLSVAVFSYDGRQRFIPPSERGVASIGISAPTKHSTSGKAYVDVFDIMTGQKALALAGPFHGDIPTNWFQDSFFIGDRYFFFDTGDPGVAVQSFWVCEINPSDSK